MKLLDGKAESERVLEGLRKKVAGLPRSKRSPGLAAVLVGDDAASAMYVGMKQKAAERVGITFRLERFPASATTAQIVQRVHALNGDGSIDGIMVQLPLPGHVKQTDVLEAINPAKDVDGLTAHSLGAVASGLPGFVPATAKAMLSLIESTGEKLSGMRACVIGRGVQTGKPIALLLLNAGCTVTVCHSITPDLTVHTKPADIIASCVGKPGLVTGSMVKPGAIIVDAGISQKEGKVVGDVDFDSCKDDAGFLTPVPGGVGPMTVAMLMENTVEAHAMHLARSKAGP